MRQKGSRLRLAGLQYLRVQIKFRNGPFKLLCLAVCLPWLYLRHCQKMPARRVRPNKERRGGQRHKKNSKRSSDTSRERFSNPPQPHDCPLEGGRQYSPSRPRVQIVKMAGKGGGQSLPRQESAETNPNRQHMVSRAGQQVEFSRGSHFSSLHDDSIAREPGGNWYNRWADSRETTTNHQLGSTMNGDWAARGRGNRPTAWDYATPGSHAFSVGHASEASDSTASAPQMYAPELHLAFASYHQIYVCPRSTPHISFPIVDYNTKRWRPGTPWPEFYMAIAPKSASVDDLKTTLAPRGSGIFLSACSSTNGDWVKLSTFKNITDLRCSTFQLEVRDIPSKDIRKTARDGPQMGRERQKDKSDPLGVPGHSASKGSGPTHRDGRKIQ